MQDLVRLVGAGLQLSIALLVLAIGLRTTWSDVTYLIRRPRLLVRSIVARNLLVPGMTMLLVLAMDLKPPVAATLLALSVAAVPPILPQSLLRAGGRDPYVIGILASQSLLAILFIPLSLAVFNAVFGARAQFAAGDVVPIIAKLTVLPLGIGMLLQRTSPRASDHAAPKIHTLGILMAVAALGAVLLMTGGALLSLLGDGTLLAMILVVLSGLAAGHLLGGPRHEDRTSLALASASSHPGLAVAIVAANTVGLARPAMAAVLLYLIVQAVVTLPYKRRERPAPWPTVHRSGRERRSRQRPEPDRRGATTTGMTI